MNPDEINFENEFVMEEIAKETKNFEIPQDGSPDRRLDDSKYVKNLIEGILLVSTEPVNVEQIAKSLGIKQDVLDDAVNRLLNDYADCGMVVRKIAGGLELGTNPNVAEHIECYFQLERKRRISRAAMQTLSIIAYNQPLTRAAIETFRGGINSDGVLDSLLERNLIKIAGRKDAPGMPYLYSVSDDFLRYFGLNNIEDLKEMLPPLDDDFARNPEDVKLSELGIVVGAVSDQTQNPSGSTENESIENLIVAADNP